MSENSQTYDLSEIFTNAAKSLVDSGKLEKMIDEALATAIKEAFGSYELKQVIRDVLTQVIKNDTALKLGIESYAKLVANQIVAIVDESGSTIGGYAGQLARELLTKEPPTSIADIINGYYDELKENIKNDYDEYTSPINEYNKLNDGYYLLITSVRKTPHSELFHIDMDEEGNWARFHDHPEISFDFQKDTDGYFEGKGYITSLKFRGFEVSPATMPRLYNKTYVQLINAYIAGGYSLEGDFERVEYGEDGETLFYDEDY